MFVFGEEMMRYSLRLGALVGGFESRRAKWEKVVCLFVVFFDF